MTYFACCVMTCVWSWTLIRSLTNRFSCVLLLATMCTARRLNPNGSSIRARPGRPLDWRCWGFEPAAMRSADDRDQQLLHRRSRSEPWSFACELEVDQRSTGVGPQLEQLAAAQSRPPLRSTGRPGSPGSRRATPATPYFRADARWRPAGTQVSKPLASGSEGSPRTSAPCGTCPCSRAVDQTGQHAAASIPG